MNDKYLKAIDSLVPREESVEKVLDAITRAEQSGKVIEMKTTKKYKKFTAIGAVAASLALVIALGAFFYPGAIKQNETAATVLSEKSGNGFFMTAYAAEATADEAEPQKITSDEFVKIGKFVPSIGFATYDVGDNGDEPNGRMVGLFNYDLRCKGENIDKVTYKIDNSTFCIKNGYKPVIEKDGKNDLFKSYSLNVGETGEYGAYYSYTVDYDNQPDLSKYEEDIKAPIQILGAVNDEEATYSDANWSEYYNSIFKDTVITVTATFKDGSKQSQKLQLNCSTRDKDILIIEAKVIE